MLLKGLSRILCIRRRKIGLRLLRFKGLLGIIGGRSFKW